MTFYNRRTFIKIGGLGILGSILYAINRFRSRRHGSYYDKKKNDEKYGKDLSHEEIDNKIHKSSDDLSDQVLSIPRRMLGNTGVPVSILGLGGAGIIAQEGQEAKEATKKIVKLAFDKGINYIDTAPTYGVSESNLGNAIANLNIDRTQLFIATKTLSRSYSETKQLLEQSLDRLQTDYIDLYQIHGINDQQDLQDIISEDGPLRAIDELKQEGKIKYTGITGHREPEVLESALDIFDFDCLLMPLNAGDVHYKPFQTELLSKANDKGVGVIAMKVMAYGNIFADIGISSASQALNYTCSFPISTAIIGFSDIKELEENISVVEDFRSLETDELREMEELTAHYYNDINHFRSW